MSRFSFLEKELPELYEKASMVEHEKDVSGAMLRIRRVLEYLVHQMGAFNKELFYNIGSLKDDGILDRHMEDLFQNTRILANRGVHEMGTPLSREEVKYCYDSLVEITAWYATGREGKRFSLKQFEPEDVARVRKYVAGAGMDGVDGGSPGEMMMENPLGTTGSFFRLKKARQDVMKREVFETREEYEERIAGMPPVHIGYAILDRRNRDEFTGTVFLQHYIDRNGNADFTGQPVFFFVEDGTGPEFADGELRAGLKVEGERICCDYDRISLYAEGMYTPVRMSSWTQLENESAEAFSKRLEALPLLPLGNIFPIADRYQLEREILPFELDPFAYTAALNLSRKYLIPCKPAFARKVCFLEEPGVLLGRVGGNGALRHMLIWHKEMGIIYSDEKDKKHLVAYYKTQITYAKDEREQLYWHEKVADESDASFQYDMACCYVDGKNGPPDVEKAAHWYRKAAEQGHVEAQYRLAQCYDRGAGVEKSPLEAARWYKEAAEQGKTEAERELGLCYETGKGTGKNMALAARWYGLAAGKGDAFAQVRLGDCYSTGAGVERNPETAFDWYEKAAAQGQTEALYNLAVCFSEGIGTPEDREKACGLFERAAGQGDVRAKKQLALSYMTGTGVSQDYGKAARWYEQAAGQGDVEAQVRIARCYMHGTGVEKDETRGAFWYGEAARNGDMGAQHHLALCYDRGTGVEENAEQAVHWYRQAADQGYAYSQDKLGDCYYEGRGVNQSYGQAVYWYEKAAGQNIASSLYRLGICCEEGLGREENPAKAVLLYQQAADQQHVEALQRLGSCREKAAEKGAPDQLYDLGCRYETGDGIKAQPQEAVYWHLKAAERGFGPAQKKVGRYYADGTGMPQDCHEAIRWFGKAVEQGEEAARYNIFSCYLTLAERGDAEARYQVGRRCENGDGTVQNYEEAVRWYSLAAEQDHVEAQLGLSRCYNNGKGVKQDYSKGAFWQQRAKKQADRKD